MSEREIFLAAIGRPGPAVRAAFLDQACGDDSDLRRRVEALLAAHEPSARPIGQPPPALAQTADSDAGPAFDAGEPPTGPAMTADYPAGAKSGVVIAGRYVLEAKIGEGGMGEVWAAKQTQPVKRRVALKLIKAGLDSRSVLARFEAERQALALMDHPNIAKVLDAGLTPTGRPFFVMEFVHGEPLNRFCDKERIGIRERLELFVPVCQAVQHAHQKGVIHRDLKPANILVGMIDGRPVPKVIDFGVAKATAGSLTDEAMATQFGAVVGTLEYMAPEQAGVTGEDADTRADVYSLGVILYELLTGLRPLDAKRLGKAAMTEMIRILRDEEPSKPSTRLSTDASLASSAAVRRIEPGRLMALLRGELDWVVMKCLEKQRDRRYETANGLARDIQRYLADEPVEARPPSAAYRLKKFVRRHRGQVIAAAAVAAALAAGVAAVIAVQVRANRDLAARNDDLAREQQKTEAERVKAAENADTAIQVVHDLSRYVSMIELSGGQAITDQERKKTLDAALVGYERLLALHPDDADVRASVARTHRYRANLCRLMNLTGDAEKSYREAGRHYGELAAAHPEVASHRKDVALTSRDFALFLKTLGRLKESTQILDVSTRVYEDLVRDGPDPVADQRPLAMMLLDRAEIDFLLGDYVETERRARRSADLYARLAETTGARVEPLDPLFRGMAELRLAMALRELDRVDDSLGVHDRAVERLGGVAKLSSSREYLNESYRAQAERAWTSARLPARRAAALDGLNAAVVGYEKLAKQFPQVPAYLRSQGSATLYRGRLKALLGQRDAAAQDLAAAAQIFEGLVGKYPDIPLYRSFLGQNYTAVGQLDADPRQAAEWYRKAREMLDGAVKQSPENFQDRKALMELDGLTKRLKP
jgi:tRNA A-37 threonylcarbamoyl transferase component Bud32